MKTLTQILLSLSALSIVAAAYFQFRRDSRIVTNPAEIARLDRAASQLTEWEHGYETRFVRATRYKNPIMGQNIGFLYPGHENDCDRKELIEFMEAHGGDVYQCGGSPGAEMFVVFKGVIDRESANTKLIEIMPALDRLVRNL